MFVIDATLKNALYTCFKLKKLRLPSLSKHSAYFLYGIMGNYAMVKCLTVCYDTKF